MIEGRRAQPGWFKAVAVVLVLWGLMGCFAWVQQVRLGANAMGPATAYDLKLYAALPAWYNLVYGIGVGCSFLGALALLARSGAARWLFAISLVAAILQFGYLFGTSDIIAVKGAAKVVPFPVFIIAVGVVQIWLAGLARRRGWIG